ncbi:MAG: hypothetical protein AAFZ15_02555 [Bacteroidota bacterium]
MVIAEIFSTVFYIYLLIGFIYGLWFVFKGVQKLDSGMSGAKVGLRLLLLPGTIALWPYMIKKMLGR